MNLNKYGEKFYDLDISVSRLVCLDLLDSDDSRSLDQIMELTEDMDGAELIALFGLEESHIPYLRGEEGLIHLLDECRSGWLVAASILRPHDISFHEDGKVSGYVSKNAYWPVLFYKNTLEEALDAIIVQAESLRNEIFAKARKEQGVPEPVADADKYTQPNDSK